MPHGPLIITLELEESHKQWFTALRKKHFPAHSNYLEAHLTLFHKLPSEEPLIPATLRELAMRPVMPLEVTAIANLGNGVAFNIVAEELKQLHQEMQQAFDPWLIRQDQQPLWPHITIQNKVTAFKAKCLQEELQVSFQPFTINAVGFSTWYYLGGPWKAADYFPFSG